MKRIALFCAFFLFGFISCKHTVTETEEICSPPDFVAYDKAPQIIKSVQPQYPEAARQAGLEGTVWLKILVDKEGRVPKAEIQKSDAEIFNQPALEAAKQFVFSPAQQAGEPVCVWVSLPFHFKL